MKAMSGRGDAHFMKILPVEQQKGQTLTAPLQTISTYQFQRWIKRDNRYIYIYMYIYLLHELKRKQGTHCSVSRHDL